MCNERKEKGLDFKMYFGDVPGIKSVLLQYSYSNNTRNNKPARKDFLNVNKITGFELNYIQCAKCVHVFMNCNFNLRVYEQSCYLFIILNMSQNQTVSCNNKSDG